MKNDDLNDRFDLSALDPFADEQRRASFVAAVMERSAFELARRRAAASSGELTWLNGSVFGVLAGWARPALAAAAVLVLISSAALQLSRRHLEANSGVIEALSVPTPVERWLVEDRTPTEADLLLAIEESASW